MKSTKSSVMYGCLIFLLSGCTGLESKMCNNDCVKKEVVVKDEKNKLTFWESGSKIMDSDNEPLVCTLMGAELAERKGALQKEIFSQVKKVDEIETGYIFSFKYDESFLMKMTDYVIAENNCCPFFTFEIKLHSKNDALLKITGPPEAKKMLEMFLADGK